MQYLIWSFEHNAWWKWARNGYTKTVGAAGVYSQAEACDICVDANRTGVNEAMVPVAFFVEDQLAQWEGEPEPDEYVTMTRSMAMDAGDRSLEGQRIKW